MNKIATAKIEKGLVDLDYSLKKNIENLADFKNTTPSNLTACVLEEEGSDGLVPLSFSFLCAKGNWRRAFKMVRQV